MWILTGHRPLWIAFAKRVVLRWALALSAIAGVFKGVYELFLTEAEQKIVVAFMLSDLMPWWPYAVFFVFAVAIFWMYWKIWSLKTPRVDILFNKSGYYESTQDQNSAGLGIRTFRVGLINLSTERLENCSARLDDLTSIDGSRPLQCPVGLDREEGYGPCPLSPDSPKHAHVIRMDERNESGPLIVTTITSLRTGDYIPNPQRLPRGTYLLEVGLHPTIGRPMRKWFLASIEQNRLCFRRATRADRRPFRHAKWR